jgi:3-oxoacyl-[acyl-carrier protein] reductase
MAQRGRVVIITGGGGGIGRRYCAAFARAGYRVVVADIRGSQEVAGELAADGHEALAVTADVSSEDSVAELADAAVAAYGGIDVLVNNAAYFSSIVKKPFEEITVEEWDKAFAVNVRGAWLCARAVSPVMRGQGWGRIINTSSMTFHGAGIDGFAHYVSTKAAIVGLTRSLAKELGAYGIVVNTISPDYVEHEGELFRRQPEMAGILAQQRPIRRPGTMDDLIGPILFLASDDVGFITGQDIWVNGGRIFG